MVDDLDNHQHAGRISEVGRHSELDVDHESDRRERNDSVERVHPPDEPNHPSTHRFPAAEAGSIGTSLAGRESLPPEYSQPPSGQADQDSESDTR